VQGYSLDIISNVCQNRFFSNDKSGMSLLTRLVRCPLFKVLCSRLLVQGYWFFVRGS